MVNIDVLFEILFSLILVVCTDWTKSKTSSVTANVAYETKLALLCHKSNTSFITGKTLDNEAIAQVHVKHIALRVVFCYVYVI